MVAIFNNLQSKDYTLTPSSSWSALEKESLDDVNNWLSLTDLESDPSYGLPIKDPYTCEKLRACLTDPTCTSYLHPDCTNASGQKAINTYLSDGLAELTDTERRVVHKFLSDSPAATIQRATPFNLNELDTIESCKKCLPSHRGEDIQIAKSFRQSIRNDLNITPTEQKFRDRMYLINPDDPQISYISNQLYFEGVITDDMSIEEIASEVLAYVQQNYNYQSEEIISKEGHPADDWQSIDETIKKNGGDCEDLAILTASLLSNVLHTKKGMSKEDVSNMVTLTAGFIETTEGNSLGHSFVKLKTDTGDLALDATSTKGPLAFSNIPYVEVMEFNDVHFKAYAPIDANFITASSVDLNFNMTLNDSTQFGIDPNQAGASLIKGNAAAYNANKDTLVWKINDQVRMLSKTVKRASQTPKMHEGTLYREMGIDFDDDGYAILKSGNQFQYDEFDDKFPADGNFARVATEADVKKDSNIYKGQLILLNAKDIQVAMNTYRRKLIELSQNRKKLNTETDPGKIQKLKKLMLQTKKDISAIYVTIGPDHPGRPVSSGGRQAGYYSADTTGNKNIKETTYSHHYEFFDVTIDNNKHASGSAVANLDAMDNLQTIRMNPDGFFDFITKIRQHINTMSLLFHMLNGLEERFLHGARDIHDMSLTDEQQRHHDKIRGTTDKLNQKFSGIFSTFQSKVSSAVDELVSELYSFVNNTNEAIFTKKDLDIDRWAQEIEEGDDVGSFIANFFVGGAADFTDSLTHALSMTRLKAKERLYRMKVMTYGINALSFNEYSRLILMGKKVDGKFFGGINLWSEDDYKTKQTQLSQDMSPGSRKNRHLFNFGSKIVNLFEESDKTKTPNYSKEHLKSYFDGLGKMVSWKWDTSSNSLKMTNLGTADQYQINTLLKIATQDSYSVTSLGDAYSIGGLKPFGIDVTALDTSPLFHKARAGAHGNIENELALESPGFSFPLPTDLIGLVLQAILNPMVDAISGSLIDRFKAPDVGAGEAYIDFNMEKQSEFRQRIMRFQNAVFIAIMTKEAEAEKWLEAAKDISGGKLTSSSTALLKIAQQAVEVELTKLIRAFDSLHQGVTSLTSEVNHLAKARLDYHKGFYQTILKPLDTAISIGSAITSFLSAASISGTIDINASIWASQYAAYTAAAGTPAAPALLATWQGNILGKEATEKMAEGYGDSNYWEYAFSTISTSIIEWTKSIFDYSVEQSVKEYQTPITLQEDFIEDGYTTVRSLDGSTQNSQFGSSRTQSTIDTLTNAANSIGKTDILNQTGSHGKNSSKLHDYYSNFLDSILLRPRMEYNVTKDNVKLEFAQRPLTFDNVPVASAFVDPNKKGLSFIESKGTGHLVFNSLLSMSKVDRITHYMNMIKRHLSILRAIHDAIENELAYMFNTQKPGGMQKLEGNAFSVIENILNVESSLIQDLKTETQTFLLPAWEANTQKAETLYNAFADMSAKSITMGTSFVTLGHPSVAELKHQGLEMAMETLDSSRKYMWGAYAPLRNNYHEDAQIQARESNILKFMKGELGGDYSDSTIKDGYQANNVNPIIPGGSLGKYTKNKASYSDYYGDAYKHTMGRFLFDKDDKNDSSETKKAVQDKAFSLARWYNSDELERSILSEMVDRSQGDTGQTPLIEKASSSLEFRQIKYGSIINTQTKLNSLHTRRMIFMMIEQMIYAQKQNLLREMFGISSSAGLLESAMQMIDRYNGGQMEKMNDIVTEMINRVEVQNAYEQGVIETSSEGASIGARILIPLVYNRFIGPKDKTSSHIRKKDWMKNILDGGSQVAMYRMVANLIVGLMGLLTVNMSTVNANDGFADKEDANESVDNKRIEELKGKEGALTITKEEKQELNAKQEKKLTRVYNQASDHTMDKDSIKLSSRGTFTVNRSILNTAQTKMKRKFRKIELQTKVLMALLDAKTDAIGELSGVESSKAFKGLSSIVSKFSSTQQQLIQHQLSQLENIAKSKSRSLDDIKKGATGLFQASLAGTAQSFIKSNKERRKKEKAERNNTPDNHSKTFSTKLKKWGYGTLDVLVPALALKAFDWGVSIAGSGRVGEDTLSDGDVASSEDSGVSAAQSADTSAVATDGTTSGFGFEFDGTADLENAILATQILKSNVSLRKVEVKELREDISKGATLLRSVGKKLKGAIKKRLQKKYAEKRDTLKENMYAGQSFAFGDPAQHLKDAITYVQNNPDSRGSSKLTPSFFMFFNAFSHRNQAVQKQKDSQEALNLALDSINNGTAFDETAFIEKATKGDTANMTARVNAIKALDLSGLSPAEVQKKVQDIEVGHSSGIASSAGHRLSSSFGTDLTDAKDAFASGERGGIFKGIGLGVLGALKMGLSALYTLNPVGFLSQASDMLDPDTPNKILNKDQPLLSKSTATRYGAYAAEGLKMTGEAIGNFSLGSIGRGIGSVLPDSVKPALTSKIGRLVSSVADGASVKNLFSAIFSAVRNILGVALLPVLLLNSIMSLVNIGNEKLVENMRGSIAEEFNRNGILNNPLTRSPLAVGRGLKYLWNTGITKAMQAAKNSLVNMYDNFSNYRSGAPVSTAVKSDISNAEKEAFQSALNGEKIDPDLLVTLSPTAQENIKTIQKQVANDGAGLSSVASAVLGFDSDVPKFFRIKNKDLFNTIASLRKTATSVDEMLNSLIASGDIKQEEKALFERQINNTLIKAKTEGRHLGSTNESLISKSTPLRQTNDLFDQLDYEFSGDKRVALDALYSREENQLSSEDYQQILTAINQEERLGIVARQKPEYVKPGKTSARQRLNQSLASKAATLTPASIYDANHASYRDVASLAFGSPTDDELLKMTPAHKAFFDEVRLAIQQRRDAGQTEPFSQSDMQSITVASIDQLKSKPESLDVELVQLRDLLDQHIASEAPSNLGFFDRVVANVERTARQEVNNPSESEYITSRIASIKSEMASLRKKSEAKQARFVLNLVRDEQIDTVGASMSQKEELGTRFRELNAFLGNLGGKELVKAKAIQVDDGTGSGNTISLYDKMVRLRNDLLQTSFPNASVGHVKKVSASYRSIVETLSSELNIDEPAALLAHGAEGAIGDDQKDDLVTTQNLLKHFLNADDQGKSSVLQGIAKIDASVSKLELLRSANTSLSLDDDALTLSEDDFKNISYKDGSDEIRFFDSIKGVNEAEALSRRQQLAAILLPEASMDLFNQKTTQNRLTAFIKHELGVADDDTSKDSDVAAILGAINSFLSEAHTHHSEANQSKQIEHQGKIGRLVTSKGQSLDVGGQTSITDTFQSATTSRDTLLFKLNNSTEDVKSLVENQQTFLTNLQSNFKNYHTDAFQSELKSLTQKTMSKSGRSQSYFGQTLDYLFDGSQTKKFLDQEGTASHANRIFKTVEMMRTYDSTINNNLAKNDIAKYLQFEQQAKLTSHFEAYDDATFRQNQSNLVHKIGSRMNTHVESGDFDKAAQTLVSLLDSGKNQSEKRAGKEMVTAILGRYKIANISDYQALTKALQTKASDELDIDVSEVIERSKSSFGSFDPMQKGGTSDGFLKKLAGTAGAIFGVGLGDVQARDSIEDQRYDLFGLSLFSEQYTHYENLTPVALANNPEAFTVALKQHSTAGLQHLIHQEIGIGKSLAGIQQNDKLKTKLLEGVTDPALRFKALQILSYDSLSPKDNGAKTLEAKNRTKLISEHHTSPVSPHKLRTHGVISDLMKDPSFTVSKLNKMIENKKIETVITDIKSAVPEFAQLIGASLKADNITSESIQDFKDLFDHLKKEGISEELLLEIAAYMDPDAQHQLFKVGLGSKGTIDFINAVNNVHANKASIPPHKAILDKTERRLIIETDLTDLKNTLDSLDEEVLTSVMDDQSAAEPISQLLVSGLAVGSSTSIAQVTDILNQLDTKLQGRRHEDRLKNFIETLGINIYHYLEKYGSHTLSEPIKDLYKSIEASNSANKQQLVERLNHGFSVAAHSPIRQILQIVSHSEFDRIQEVFRKRDIGAIEGAKSTILDLAMKHPSQALKLVSALDSVEGIMGAPESQPNLILNHMVDMVDKSATQIDQAKHSESELKNLRSFFLGVASDARTQLDITPDQIATTKKTAQDRLAGLSVELIAADEAGTPINILQQEIEKQSGIVALADLYQNSLDKVGLTERYLKSRATGENTFAHLLQDVGDTLAKETNAPKSFMEAFNTLKKSNFSMASVIFFQQEIDNSENANVVQSLGKDRLQTLAKQAKLTVLNQDPNSQLTTYTNILSFKDPDNLSTALRDKSKDLAILIKNSLIDLPQEKSYTDFQTAITDITKDRGATQDNLATITSFLSEQSFLLSEEQRSVLRELITVTQAQLQITDDDSKGVVLIQALKTANRNQTEKLLTNLDFEKRSVLFEKAFTPPTSISNANDIQTVKDILIGIQQLLDTASVDQADSAAIVRENLPILIKSLEKIPTSGAIQPDIDSLQKGVYTKLDAFIQKQLDDPTKDKKDLTLQLLALNKVALKQSNQSISSTSSTSLLFGQQFAVIRGSGEHRNNLSITPEKLDALTQFATQVKDSSFETALGNMMDKEPPLFPIIASMMLGVGADTEEVDQLTQELIDIGQLSLEKSNGTSLDSAYLRSQHSKNKISVYTDYLSKTIPTTIPLIEYTPTGSIDQDMGIAKKYPHFLKALLDKDPREQAILRQTFAEAPTDKEKTALWLFAQRISPDFFNESLSNESNFVTEDTLKTTFSATDDQAEALYTGFISQGFIDNKGQLNFQRIASNLDSFSGSNPAGLGAGKVRAGLLRLINKRDLLISDLQQVNANIQADPLVDSKTKDMSFRHVKESVTTLKQNGDQLFTHLAQQTKAILDKSLKGPSSRLHIKPQIASSQGALEQLKPLLGLDDVKTFEEHLRPYGSDSEQLLGLSKALDTIATPNTQKQFHESTVININQAHNHTRTALVGLIYHDQHTLSKEEVTDFLSNVTKNELTQVTKDQDEQAIFQRFSRLLPDNPSLVHQLMLKAEHSLPSSADTTTSLKSIHSLTGNPKTSQLQNLLARHSKASSSHIAAILNNMSPEDTISYDDDGNILSNAWNAIELSSPNAKDYLSDIYLQLSDKNMKLQFKQHVLTPSNKLSVGEIANLDTTATTLYEDMNNLKLDLDNYTFKKIMGKDTTHSLSRAQEEFKALATMASSSTPHEQALYTQLTQVNSPDPLTALNVKNDVTFSDSFKTLLDVVDSALLDPPFSAEFEKFLMSPDSSDFKKQLLTFIDAHSATDNIPQDLQQFLMSNPSFQKEANGYIQDHSTKNEHNLSFVLTTAATYKAPDGYALTLKDPDSSDTIATTVSLFKNTVDSNLTDKLSSFVAHNHEASVNGLSQLISDPSKSELLSALLASPVFSKEMVQEAILNALEKKPEPDDKRTILNTVLSSPTLFFNSKSGKPTDLNDLFEKISTSSPNLLISTLDNPDTTIPKKTALALAEYLHTKEKEFSNILIIISLINQMGIAPKTLNVSIENNNEVANDATLRGKFLKMAEKKPTLFSQVQRHPQLGPLIAVMEDNDNFRESLENLEKKQTMLTPLGPLSRVDRENTQQAIHTFLSTITPKTDLEKSILTYTNDDFALGSYIDFMNNMIANNHPKADILVALLQPYVTTIQKQANGKPISESRAKALGKLVSMANNKLEAKKEHRLIFDEMSTTQLGTPDNLANALPKLKMSPDQIPSFLDNLQSFISTSTSSFTDSILYDRLFSIPEGDTFSRSPIEELIRLNPDTAEGDKARHDLYHTLLQNMIKQPPSDPTKFLRISQFLTTHKESVNMSASQREFIEKQMITRFATQQNMLSDDVNVKSLSKIFSADHIQPSEKKSFVMNILKSTSGNERANLQKNMKTLASLSEQDFVMSSPRNAELMGEIVADYLLQNEDAILAEQKYIVPSLKTIIHNDLSTGDGSFLENLTLKMANKLTQTGSPAGANSLQSMLSESVFQVRLDMQQSEQLNPLSDTGDQMDRALAQFLEKSQKSNQPKKLNATAALLGQFMARSANENMDISYLYDSALTPEKSIDLAPRMAREAAMYKGIFNAGHTYTIKGMSVYQPPVLESSGHVLRPLAKGLGHTDIKAAFEGKPVDSTELMSQLTLQGIIDPKGQAQGDALETLTYPSATNNSISTLQLDMMVEAKDVPTLQTRITQALIETGTLSVDGELDETKFDEDTFKQSLIAISRREDDSGSIVTCMNNIDHHTDFVDTLKSYVTNVGSKQKDLKARFSALKGKNAQEFTILKNLLTTTYAQQTADKLTIARAYEKEFNNASGHTEFNVENAERLLTNPYGEGTKLVMKKINSLNTAFETESAPFTDIESSFKLDKGRILGLLKAQGFSKKGHFNIPENASLDLSSLHLDSAKEKQLRSQLNTVSKDQQSKQLDTLVALAKYGSKHLIHTPVSEVSLYGSKDPKSGREKTVHSDLRQNYMSTLFERPEFSHLKSSFINRLSDSGQHLLNGWATDDSIGQLITDPQLTQSSRRSLLKAHLDTDYNSTSVGFNTPSNKKLIDLTNTVLERIPNTPAGNDILQDYLLQVRAHNEEGFTAYFNALPEGSSSKDKLTNSGLSPRENRETRALILKTVIDTSKQEKAKKVTLDSLLNLVGEPLPNGGTVKPTTLLLAFKQLEKSHHLNEASFKDFTSEIQKRAKKLGISPTEFLHQLDTTHPTDSMLHKKLTASLMGNIAEDKQYLDSTYQTTKLSFNKLSKPASDSTWHTKDLARTSTTYTKHMGNLSSMLEEMGVAENHPTSIYIKENISAAHHLHTALNAKSSEEFDASLEHILFAEGHLASSEYSLNRRQTVHALLVSSGGYNQLQAQMTKFHGDVALPVLMDATVDSFKQDELTPHQTRTLKDSYGNDVSSLQDLVRKNSSSITTERMRAIFNNSEQSLKDADPENKAAILREIINELSGI